MKQRDMVHPNGGSPVTVTPSKIEEMEDKGWTLVPLPKPVIKSSRKRKEVKSKGHD